MAEKIISPGVFQNESDQSLVQRGIQGTATAIVGPTVKGAPFVPTYVTSYTDSNSSGVNCDITFVFILKLDELWIVFTINDFIIFIFNDVDVHWDTNVSCFVCFAVLLD